MTTLAPTIYTRTFPRATGWVQDLVLIMLGAVFVAVLAQVKIALPFTPVPLTGQIFAVLLIGATLGYLVGFVIAAYVIGLLAERGLERNVRTSLIPFFVGTTIIYVCGVTWLAVVLESLSKAITAGLLPFLIGDTLKLIAAALVLPAAWRLVR